MAPINKRTNDPLIGYEKLYTKLRPLLDLPAAGRFILIEGSQGLGKCLIAQRLLTEWAQLTPLLITPDNLRIGYSIEQVRWLTQQIQQMGLTSSRLGVVLDDLHLLPTVCANALLKTLEELPSHLIVIGIAPSDPPLLATLRSRALKVHVTPYSDEEMTQWLQANSIEPTESLLRYADGSPAVALDYLSEAFNLRLPHYRLLAQASNYTAMAQALQTIDEIEKDKSLNLTPQQLLQECLRLLSVEWKLQTREWSTYQLWLDAVTSAQESLSRSGKLTHAIETLWLRLEPYIYA